VLRAVQLLFWIPELGNERARVGVVVGLDTTQFTPFQLVNAELVTVPPEVGAIYQSPVALVLSTTSICPLVHAGCLIGFVQSCVRISPFAVSREVL